jgi:hypothetical protein
VESPQFNKRSIQKILEVANAKMELDPETRDLLISLLALQVIIFHQLASSVAEAKRHIAIQPTNNIPATYFRTRNETPDFDT